jgi:hypothetical protein
MEIVPRLRPDAALLSRAIRLVESPDRVIAALRAKVHILAG